MAILYVHYDRCLFLVEDVETRDTEIQAHKPLSNECIQWSHMHVELLVSLCSMNWQAKYTM